MVRLGIVLATRVDLAHAHAIALAAKRARVDVALFAMDAGVGALATDPCAVADLLEADCELTACSSSAAGIALPDGVVRGSQDDHAALLATCDRVVALT